MLSCLKLKDKTPKFQKLEMEELVLEEAFVKRFCQNVQHAIVKNRDLSKSNKQIGY